MRWIAVFVFMAIMFGGLTEAFGAINDKEEFSLKMAIIRGVLFSVPMTAFQYYNSKRKSK